VFIPRVLMAGKLSVTTWGLSKNI